MKKKVKSNKKEEKDIKDYFKNILFIPVRYLILLVLTIILMFPLSNPRIYSVLTPITIHPVVWLLKIFYETSLVNNFIIINLTPKIEIIPACIAGSAYLLLLILNLTVPMNILKRFYSLILSFLLLLILNISRIFLLSVLYYNDFTYFDITHKVFWYVLSTLFVIGIWFLMVKIFSIKEIPVYSDFKTFYNIGKNKKL